MFAVHTSNTNHSVLFWPTCMRGKGSEKLQHILSLPSFIQHSEYLLRSRPSRTAGDTKIKIQSPTTISSSSSATTIFLTAVTLILCYALLRSPSNPVFKARLTEQQPEGPRPAAPHPGQQLPIFSGWDPVSGLGTQPLTAH